MLYEIMDTSRKVGECCVFSDGVCIVCWSETTGFEYYETFERLFTFTKKRGFTFSPVVNWTKPKY